MFGIDRRGRKIVALATLFSLFVGAADAADGTGDRDLKTVVDGLVRPLMDEYDVPGMAVAVVAHGERQVFTYGVTAPGGSVAVSADTIFEIGSLSKAFTATLAAYAVATGKLSLTDTVSSRMPELAASEIGDRRLLDLGTFTAGGLPLQFPDAVTDEADMVAYYRGWQPDYAAATTRLYSNPSAGLFGHLAARSLDADFADLMEERLFPAFGLRDTFVNVPEARMDDYAFGLSKDGRTVRVNPGMFDAEAYGIKTTAGDLSRFVEANIDPSGLDEDWRRAVTATQEARYRVGPMMQGLGWELYDASVSLDDLLAGNSAEMALEPHAIKAVGLDAGAPVLVDKTGSTGGFGAYALFFVPTQDVGVVMLANRNVPIPARVRVAFAILAQLR